MTGCLRVFWASFFYNQEGGGVVERGLGSVEGSNYLAYNIYNRYAFLQSLCFILIIFLICAIFIILHMKNRADRKLNTMGRELSHITNSMHVGVVNFLINNGEDDFKITYASKGFYDMIGYSVKEVEEYNNYILPFLYPTDVGIITSLRNSSYHDNFQREVRMITKEGKVICLLFNGNFIVGKDGVSTVAGVLVDVTESKQMQEKLELEEERYRVATEISNDILFEYKMIEDVMIFADKFSELYGKNSVITNFSKCNSEFLDCICQEDVGVFTEYTRALRSGKEMVESEFRLRDETGGYVWCHTRGKTIFDEGKRPIRVIGKVVNIDLHKKELQKLEYKAKRDPLTNVYNKNTTKDLIDQLIGLNPGEHHVFMFIDIDDFKNINDTYGHLKGDHVLTYVINQIKEIFGEGEILGRIGGDEFVVFISNVEEVTIAKEKAGLIQKALGAVYEDEEDMISVSGSIGISIYPQDGFNYNELLCSADKAMYQVKESGKDGYQLCR